MHHTRTSPPTHAAEDSHIHTTRLPALSVPELPTQKPGSRGRRSLLNAELLESSIEGSANLPGSGPVAGFQFDGNYLHYVSCTIIADIWVAFACFQEYQQ